MTTPTTDCPRIKKTMTEGRKPVELVFDWKAVRESLRDHLKRKTQKVKPI